LADKLARRIGKRLAKIVVLDASALIALFSDKDLHHNWAVQMLVDTIAWELQLISLNMAEAMVHPTKAGRLNQFTDSIRGLGIEVTSVDSSDAARLAQIRASTNLRMPDALVLNQAMRVGGAIATTDKELARVAASQSVGVFSPS
jgi:predicted nucleic acid-binding protein